MATDDFKNVRITFWNRVKGQLDTGTYGVAYDGLDFDTDAQTAWFEPHLLNEVSLSRRSANRNEEWLFQVNCFTKTGPLQQTPVAIWTMVGVVRDAFEYQGVSSRDWDGAGDPHDVYLLFDEMSAEPIPQDDDHQMMVACTFTGRINE